MGTIFMPQIYKVLREKFDSLPYCLTINSYIFGGAIRDALAGKEIQGDLDIAVPSSNLEATTLFNRISILAKSWVEQDVNIFHYNYSKLPIASIINLKNRKSGALAQIMAVKEATPLSHQGLRSQRTYAALKLVKEVDIICCGVALDCFGNVYEAVPQAIDHCRRRIIMATEKADKNNERYKKRVQKLVGRGWTVA